MNSSESVAADEGNKAGQAIGNSRGLWILIGGLVGIIIVISVALWILYQRRAERKAQKTGTVTISMHSFSEEPSSLNISLKEIYSATNNLSASHFIGQGIADKGSQGMGKAGKDYGGESSKGTFPGPKPGSVMPKDKKHVSTMIGEKISKKVTSILKNDKSKIKPQGQ
nr:probable receptor-like protein kinase At5g18500 [Ipomoea batatas]